MVDEEGFSPMEMSRLMSDKVAVDKSGNRMLGETVVAGNVMEGSMYRPTSLLKSPVSGVKFDMQSISDDEDEENIDRSKNHGAATQDDTAYVAKYSARSNRPSTSNFFENRSELNSGRVSSMDSVKGSLNLDTHTNDEVMRKM